MRCIIRLGVLWIVLLTLFSTNLHAENELARRLLGLSLLNRVELEIELAGLLADQKRLLHEVERLQALGQTGSGERKIHGRRYVVLDGGYGIGGWYMRAVDIDHLAAAMVMTMLDPQMQAAIAAGPQGGGNTTSPGKPPAREVIRRMIRGLHRDAHRAGLATTVRSVTGRLQERLTAVRAEISRVQVALQYCDGQIDRMAARAAGLPAERVQKFVGRRPTAPGDVAEVSQNGRQYSGQVSDVVKRFSSTFSVGELGRVERAKVQWSEFVLDVSSQGDTAVLGEIHSTSSGTLIGPRGSLGPASRKFVTTFGRANRQPDGSYRGKYTNAVTYYQDNRVHSRKNESGEWKAAPVPGQKNAYGILFALDEEIRKGRGAFPKDRSAWAIVRLVGATPGQAPATDGPAASPGNGQVIPSSPEPAAAADPDPGDYNVSPADVEATRRVLSQPPQSPEAGQLALLSVSQKGFASAARALVARGVDPLVASGTSESVMEKVLQKGSPHMATALTAGMLEGATAPPPVKKQADEDRMVRMVTAKPQIAKALAERTLLTAAMKGAWYLARALIDEVGANPSAVDANTGFTPLHWAATYGHGDVIELLVSRGADLHKKNVFGQTPLDVARNVLHQEAVAQLIAAEGLRRATKLAELLKGASCPKEARALAQVLAQYDRLLPSYRTHLFMTAAYSGWPTTLAALLAKGEKPEQKDVLGMTALHHAAQGGQPVCVAMMLQKGAAVEAKNKAGQTPLHFAVQAGDRQSVLYLLSAGADPSLGLEGGSSLFPPDKDISELLKDVAKRQAER